MGFARRLRCCAEYRPTGYRLPFPPHTKPCPYANFRLNISTSLGACDVTGPFHVPAAVACGGCF